MDHHNIGGQKFLHHEPGRQDTCRDTPIGATRYAGWLASIGFVAFTVGRPWLEAATAPWVSIVVVFLFIWVAVKLDANRIEREALRDIGVSDHRVDAIPIAPGAQFPPLWDREMDG